MKIFHISWLMKPGTFAQFAHVGTWTDGELCSVCGVTSEKLIPPLQIEWEPGTENIGDFAWCYSTCCVVNDSVRRFLEQSKFECSFAPVEVLKPTEKTRVKRVHYPYTGPKLHWVRCTNPVPLLEKQSGVSIKTKCSKCGRLRYDVKGEHFVIQKKDWKQSKMFGIQQFGLRAIYLSEEAATLLESQNFTGYKLVPAGEIVD